MEERLAAYRARKAKESKPASWGFRTGLFKRVPLPVSGNPLEENTQTETTAPYDTNSLGVHGRSPGDDASSMEYDDGTNDMENYPVNNGQHFSSNSNVGRAVHTSTFLHLALKAILWVSLFGLFICLGFGTIFFILSLFYIIYATMRGERRKHPGEKSAYSVFNPNCERIHGTFTAEQFEKEMLYGIGAAVR